MPADVRRAIRQAARHIARVAFRQIPKHWDLEVVPGVSIEQRIEPHRARRLLRSGRTLSAALVAPDDGGARARRRRRRDHRRLPAARAGRDGGGARGRRHEAVPRRRRARDCGARVRNRRRFHASTRSSGPATGTWLRRSRWSRATARSTSMPVRPKSSSSPARAGRPGSRPTSSRRASTIPDARAILITWSRRVRRTRRRHRRRRAPRDARSSSDRSRPTAPSSSLGSADEAMALANRFAPEHLVVDREVTDTSSVDGRRRLRRPVHRAGRGRLRDRLEPCAADLRRRALSRRPERRRFRARHVGAARHRRTARLAYGRGLRAPRLEAHAASIDAPRGLTRTRRVDQQVLALSR